MKPGKITVGTTKGEQGSALAITLILGVLLLTVLASYLLLLTSQKNLATRSQTWNTAMTMSEAGIEEGLAQINASNSAFNIVATTNFSGNNWGGSAPNYGPKTVNLIGGYYSAAIVMNSTPTIYSTGYATVPVVGGTITRVVEVTTLSEPLINVGLGAIGGIQFNGNGIATDSYNSTLTNLSNNGQYDPSKTSTNGDVASVQGLVNIGNHTISGNLYLGPTATYAGGGTITGNIDYNYNVQFPDVTLPANASGWPTAAPASTTTYVTNVNNGHVSSSTTTAYDFTTSGNYIVNSDAYPVYVEAGVTVKLNVTSTTWNITDLEIHGGMTNSGTAIIYLNGPTSATLSGNSAVDASNRPDNLWYFGLPSLTSMTFSGTSSFVGVVYAPEVSLTLNGGGGAFGVMGSVIVGNVTMNGHYDFHYDESLSTFGPTRGYVANSWREIY